MNVTLREAMRKHASSAPAVDEFWRNHSTREPLLLLPSPCFDCAMVCGFYKEMADELLLQPPDIVDKVRLSWFCHNHPDRACKGATEYIEANKRMAVSE